MAVLLTYALRVALDYVSDACCSCKSKGGEAVLHGSWAGCLAISLDYVSKSSVSKATTRLRQVRYAY